MKDIRVHIKIVAMVLFTYIRTGNVRVRRPVVRWRGPVGGNHCATGMLAAALLAVQTVDRNVFRPRTWNPRIAGKTIVVGVAIHYSAMIIGVSFGAVFSAESGSIGGTIAVLIQQAVLTCAAWILVNQFRQRRD